jgi:UDP-N-acetylglucosamine transferase subunit ALG13
MAKVKAATLVTVGNAKQPFDRLLSAVNVAFDLLPRPLVVQSGPSQIRIASADFQADVLPQSDFQANLRTAEIVISHAGAGSILSSLASGLRPIVFVRLSRLGEHVDDHQVEFARNMHQRGLVYICESGEGVIELIKRTDSSFRLGRHANTNKLVQAISASIGRNLS